MNQILNPGKSGRKAQLCSWLVVHNKGICHHALWCTTKVCATVPVEQWCHKNVLVVVAQHPGGSLKAHKIRSDKEPTERPWHVRQIGDRVLGMQPKA
jgi:hypothetical protein